jgi:predicted ATP-dependent endonuclease of OLD family
MLTSIRIQNFRSIRDASVKLGQVNLFIGPNNSGKSNFLKGISLMAFAVNEFPRNTLKPEHFISYIPRNLSLNSEQRVIRVVAQADNIADKAVSLIIGYDYDINSERPFFTTEILVKPSIQEEHKFTGYVDQGYHEDEEQFVPNEIHKLSQQTSGLLIYKIEPSSFSLSVALAHQPRLSASGKNIVNFLYYLGQNYKSRYRALEADFARCVHDLVSISTPADPDEAGKLKLKFFDKNDTAYWAEEVSEGVLYFLGLLCIVHQPEPPQLLLLEEPEKGIHPRRIRETMNFIFELARLRNIQIILTSHSPYVVDHFADIPECISVFDRENGETVIHNAADLIEKTNEEYAEQGLPPTKYKDSLGEYWVSGFLGGVPL